MFEFIRIENDDGLGPYVAEDELDISWQEHNHHDSEFTPSIHYDEGFNSEDRMIYDLNSRKNKAVSGFSSLSQLEQWFSPKELKTLKGLGFKINYYMVKELRDSGLQSFVLKKDIIKKTF